MEKAKISNWQLFVLLLLFELGSAQLVPTAIGAKQDAWMAILIAMVGGFLLFLIYHRLYQYYPNIPLTEYVQKLTGKIFGRFFAFLYILYFSYVAARVLRDFGEMLVTVAYLETPLFIANALFMVVIIYSVRKGIEVLARAGELFFVLIYILAISGFILLVASGTIDVNNLRPVLEEGIMPILTSAFTETLFFPFGEVIVFAMIMPYLNKPEKVKKTGLLAIGLSGINLTLVMAMNICVLGVDLTSRSPFPLLSTIQTIQIAEFLERLDVYFMIAMIIGGFFKICLFIYAAVAGASGIFNISQPEKLVYPMGLVILFLSITIASNYTEHLHEGITHITFILHLPFQVIIPSFLLVIAFFKNRKKQGAVIKAE
ncbi:GerAB/ArcD/ProY family transporter [Niallia oryzisoli]|uniref:GerAB/ArcD/ProY family transporter n=1 Tax=Niallia oryzisoli TaxID=1737571 RepID=A0ABZ2CFP1_9BACI